MSEQTLVQKLADVMAEVGYVQKDATNEFHKYRYASAAAVLSKVNAALSSRGIAVSSMAELVAHDRIQGDKDKHKTIAVVKLTLIFNDGTDALQIEGLGSGEDTGDKAVMKANTAALKYALANAFLISWGDDPEADPSTDGAQVDGAEAIATDEWLVMCEQASGSPLATFKKWWPTNKAKILDDCGKEGAARVYEMFTIYLARLRKEVEDAGD